MNNSTHCLCMYVFQQSVTGSNSLSSLVGRLLHVFTFASLEERFPDWMCFVAWRPGEGRQRRGSAITFAVGESSFSASAGSLEGSSTNLFTFIGGLLLSAISTGDSVSLGGKKRLLGWLVGKTAQINAISDVTYDLALLN